MLTFFLHFRSLTAINLTITFSNHLFFHLKKFFSTFISWNLKNMSSLKYHLFGETYIHLYSSFNHSFKLLSTYILLYLVIISSFHLYSIISDCFQFFHLYSIISGKIQFSPLIFYPVLCFSIPFFSGLSSSVRLHSILSDFILFYLYPVLAGYILFYLILSSLSRLYSVLSDFI